MKSNKLFSVYSMAQIAVCTALICVSTFIAIPLPFIPVPFTLQVLAVILVALILSPAKALSAQVLYTLLGVVGLPVFSGGKGGFAAILSPTGGFIFGFILASFLVSLLKGNNEGKSNGYKVARYIIVSVVIGIPCIYIFGIVGFMLYTASDILTAAAAVAGVFALVDIAKCVIASLIAIPLGKAIALSMKKTA